MHDAFSFGIRAIPQAASANANPPRWPSPRPPPVTVSAGSWLIPPRRTQENHRRRHFLRQDHRVVSRSADHAVRLAAGATRSPPRLRREFRIHRHRRLVQHHRVLHRQPAPAPQFLVRDRTNASTAPHANRVRAMSHVQRRARFPGNHVHRTRLRCHAADRRHQTLHPLALRAQPRQSIPQRPATASRRKFIGVVPA